MKIIRVQMLEQHLPAVVTPLMHFIHDNPVIFLAIYTCALTELVSMSLSALPPGSSLEAIMQHRLVTRSRFNKRPVWRLQTCSCLSLEAGFELRSPETGTEFTESCAFCDNLVKPWAQPGSSLHHKSGWHCNNFVE